MLKFAYPSSVLFTLVVFWSMVLAVNSGDPLFFWLSMELGSLGFVGLAVTFTGRCYGEGVANYYLPNSSSNLFFLILVLWYKGSGEFFFAYLAMVPLLVKLGVPPFHFWMPNAARLLPWFPLFALLGPLNLAPLHGLVWGGPLDSLYLFFGILGAFWGGIGGMNQVLLNKVIVYSSVAVMGWILSVSCVDVWVPYVCWALYSLTLIGLLFSVQHNPGVAFGRNSCLLLFIVLMAGWPAGPVFTIKWLCLSSLVGEGIFFPGVLLALSSAVSVPIYMGVVFSSLIVPYVGGVGSLSRFKQTNLKVLAFFLSSSFFWAPLFL